MSTVIRRRRTSRLSIGPYRRHEFLTGRIQYPVQGYTGYGDGDGVGTDLKAFIGPEMRADWAANRAALMDFWQSGMPEVEVFPHDCLPWLCFGRPRDRPPRAVEYLD